MNTPSMELLIQTNLSLPPGRGSTNASVTDQRSRSSFVVSARNTRSGGAWLRISFSTVRRVVCDTVPVIGCSFRFGFQELPEGVQPPVPARRAFRPEIVPFGEGVHDRREDPLERGNLRARVLLRQRLQNRRL